MSRIVKLGAPSLTGKDANDLVAEVFGDAEYPLTVTVKNHMPTNVVFPEVPGLFLRHVANAEESQKTVVIESHDLFQRLASSIEQVASLNRYALALTISDGDIPVEGSAGGEGTGETVTKRPSDGLNGEQLKEALKAKGIEFPNNAKKAELAALLDNAPADDAGSAGGEGTGANGATGGQQDPAA